MVPLRHLAPSQALASLVGTTEAFEAPGSAAGTADSVEAFGITAGTTDAFEAGSDSAAGATRPLYGRFAGIFSFMSSSVVLFLPLSLASASGGILFSFTGG